MEKDQVKMAGHPNPQGVEKYGGIRKARVILKVKRDIPEVLAEKYGIPISMHIERLIIEDNGVRRYSDIYWVQGTWKDPYNDAGADNDIKIIKEMIKATLSQYEPRKANPPKIPVEIEIERIEYDWEMGKLWRFEVITTVRYHWENGIKTMKLAIKFPSGEIYTNSLAKVYWDSWITNSVAEFLLHNDPFNPETWLLDKKE